MTLRPASSAWRLSDPGCPGEGLGAGILVPLGDMKGCFHGALCELHSGGPGTPLARVLCLWLGRSEPLASSPTLQVNPPQPTPAAFPLEARGRGPYGTVVSLPRS